MFNALPGNVEAKLWKHQSEALAFALKHLKADSSACLLRLPTGTGKTGVIACLTMLANQGSSLVLTPWAHLRDQMVSDLERGFWLKLGVPLPSVNVAPVLPTTAKRLLADATCRVLVATFTTLNDLRLNRPDIYSALKSAVSLVIVDEGHYEPAVQWSKAVKGLASRTVLLTATPYRNDLKLFRITDPAKSAHHFTHKKAEERHIIRPLAFESLATEPRIPAMAQAFAKMWKAAKRANTLPSKEPRAIVCCGDSVDIEQTVTHLRAAGVEALGVHEQFEGSRRKHLRKDVPDPRKVNFDVWVHQNKLTEGLDDHRFSCLALFTRIRNDRKLIQQIGRILRKDAGDRNRPALLVAPNAYAVEDQWSAYRAFETELRLLEPQHFRDVVETLLGAQPEVEYFEGRFRTRFNPGELSAKPQVIIPPSVLVRLSGKGFSLDEYIEDCTDTLNTADAVILGPSLTAPCQRSSNHALWVYASVHNSRLLESTSLYEITLETHCVVVRDGLVFISDSGGNLPSEYLEEETRGAPADQLTRFIDRTFRPTHVSVNSSLPYDTVVRGAELHGHDLLSIPASLTDRIQICRAARASSKAHGRRYVGLTNGRIRSELAEEARRRFDLTTFLDWTTDVSEILKKTTAGSPLFQRFMQTCSPPAVVRPRTLTVNLLRLNAGVSIADGAECRLTASSIDVVESAAGGGLQYTCSFDIESASPGDKEIQLALTYDQSKRRFWFTKKAGVSVRVDSQEANAPAKTLADFLNQNQDLVLIGLDGGDIVYQGRNFYKIDYSYAEGALVGLIQQPGGQACGTEKGTKGQIAEARARRATRFPSGSLFKAIVERDVGVPFGAELLICADLGTECADFLAANFSERRLALLHAKTGSGTGISASAFHDIVAQAMKNLVYLTRNAEVPKGVNSWEGQATWNRTGVRRLSRTTAGLPTRGALWTKIKNDIVNGSNPDLHVVLVTSGCCSVAALRDAIADPSKRTPEMAQLVHLLDGLNGHARQLGVKLSIYDLPYRAP